MLKALELSGFKSFADKTRFDFPDGITVVVGPNGSGKSNIVDAMKWVLGSQSAKSLRGKEMSDVIFKGSQTRGPAGSAEVTIVFDNPDGALPVDAPEVHVTRRVYRSGEGEYLINGSPVRLKDVKDLIRGTGIGIDAYSLIEQGKVDKMLQANAKDRRAIFEEAAGISRFKAKKIEAERRLARVQSNLTRLGDIVDEVGSRLKSLRSQASKAERYRHATERMKDLRLSLAWTDWRHLSTEIESTQTDLASAQKRRDELEQLREEMTQQRQAADASLHEIADEAREVEQQRSRWIGEVAQLEGRRDADQASIADLRNSVAASLRRVRLLQAQAGSAAAELRGANERLESYRIDLTRVRKQSEEAQSERDEIQQEALAVRKQRDDLGRQHLASVRSVADYDSKRQRLEQRIAETARTISNLSRRMSSADSVLEIAKTEAHGAAATVARLDDSIAEATKEIQLADAKVSESKRMLTRRQEEVSALKIRLQGISERFKVLSDLEARQEGISGGVQAILKQIGSDEASLSQYLHGMVADCIEVDTKVAPLIDAALGQRSQYLIVESGRIQQSVLDGQLKLNHRVGLIRIDELPSRRPGDRIRLDGLRGVLGRGDRMVKCDAKFEPLLKHLLSSTWLVDTLATALGLRKLSGAGLRFVTAAGELLENDGSTVVGPTAAATGLVSRKSELSSAAKEIKHYEFQLQEAEAETKRLAGRVDQESADLGRIEQRQRQLITDRAAAEAERRHADQRLEEQQAACDEITAEITATNLLRDTASSENTLLQAKITEGKQEIERLELATAEADEMLSETQEALQTATAGVMSINVDVARAEQKYEALSATMQQQRRDHDQREAAVTEVRDQADHGKSRIKDLNIRVLDASNRLAQLAWDVENCDGRLKALAESAASVRSDNKAILKASEVAIKDAAKASEQVVSITARSENAVLRRETLVSRLMDDYEVDLRVAEPPEDFEEPEDRDEVEEEITKLRGQLQRTTNVNLEALQELEGLQTRYDELHGQYQDLTAAKDSLQRIIGRINADSRRLFLDTLEAIRQNFQQLYRKSFGGGHADLVLEDADDPLEAGVEIVATPPGKPSFSNSLLSGGEKALTAVALLMSIFKYRPSPFCVLDEVDAPFDEANIGRFVTVLNEFLDHSKFVVVTHSKKTMTAATTLYGVTMQESGISKRVSIRFEDVSDNGEISDGEAA